MPDSMSAFLTSNGYRVLSEPRERLPVRVEDAFISLGKRPIDLLKIDIEGVEHVLLDDTRFASLNARVVVMEWHDTEQYPDGRVHARGRLADCGFRVISDPDGIPKSERKCTGLIWAVRTTDGL